MAWEKNERLTLGGVLRELWLRSEDQDSWGFPCQDDDCCGFCAAFKDWAACFRCGAVYEFKPEEAK